MEMINEEGEENNKSKYKIEYLGEKFSKDLKVYKVIILGLYGVGKTAIIHKLKREDFDKEYEPTISIDIKMFQVKINDRIIQIQIWDTCGNDEYAQSIPNLFKNTSITILVYAINNRSSFKNLQNWYSLVKEYSFDNTIFIIGNKNDLKKEREVTIEDAETFKNNYDNVKIFLETSALYGENMNKLFENIVISAYEKDINVENKLDNALRKSLTLTKEDFSKKGKEKKKKFC